MTTVSFSSLTQQKPLLILDLANNHNGNVDHGKRIIDDLAKVNFHGLPVAIKFQYRNLPEFIHHEFRDRRDIKYVDRFLSTYLNWDQFNELKDYIRSNGFLTACTPFDEYSVTKIVEHDFDILKVASASFQDWPLWEAISAWQGSIVASTAGASVDEIDRVVSFLQNRQKSFALMHCVAAYPTLDADLQLRRISTMSDRYGNIPIGYSTHEDPKNVTAGGLALASGAVILERHVATSAPGISVNAYSSEAKDLQLWVDSIVAAASMLGAQDVWNHRNESEQVALKGLRRYAFAKSSYPAGAIIDFNSVYFAIPGEEDQYQANDFSKYSRFTLLEDVSEGQAISTQVAIRSSNEKTVTAIRNAILELIDSARITVPRNAELEISHHYGINDFANFGMCMITVVNREYCKKLLILLPGQRHPAMFHKDKDETFFLLHGDLNLLLDNTEVPIGLGDTVHVKPGVVHEFWTTNGAIIEEVSSNHSLTDSFYVDEEISKNKSRKTFIKYWA